MRESTTRHSLSEGDRGRDSYPPPAVESSSLDRRPHLPTRRAALAAVGSAAVTVLAGCTSIAGSGQSKLQQQLATVRDATAKYEDPKQALADGFAIGGPYVPGMGWHFSHPKRLQQTAQNGINLTTPPILTYLETDDGLALGSIEYGGPADAIPTDPDLFADETADRSVTEEWHTHKAATHVCAVPDGTQTPPKEIGFEDWTTNTNWAEFRPPNTDLNAGDTIALDWGSMHGKEGETTERIADFVTTHPDLRTLHVWVHIENPDGVFAPINPDYTNKSHSH